MGKSWRTSLVGWIAIASGVAGFVGDLIVTQGVPQTLPEYFVFGGLVLGGIGNILAKDANVSHSQHPASEPNTVPPVVPVVLLCLVMATLAGCSSYMPTQDGRYQRVKSAQEPVAFGVSNSYAMLESCKGTQVEGYYYEKLDFSECFDLPQTRQHASAPGYFPSLFNGLMNFAGFGWVASAQSGGSASATSTSISNAASSASGGGGGGHGGHK